MTHARGRHIRGWIAVGLSAVITSLWAFWGIAENFHEGWYHESLWMNLGLMFLQYLGFMLGFLVLALVAIRWPWAGFVLHLALAGFAAWFFRYVSWLVFWVFMVVPLLGIGLLYLTGRPEPRRRAVALVVGLPLLTLLITGSVPAWRVAQRVDDGDRGLRRVRGNGVVLEWAPAGPGWPRKGGDWSRASDACRHLEEDGTTLADEPLDLWRLPTADEVVRSLTWRGENAGGVIDPETGEATYQTSQRPNKETPLWDPHSPVTYWWTGSEVAADGALRVSHNGYVRPTRKSLGPDYYGFRCVREAKR